MIDIRKLKELVRLMVANELTELDLRDSEEQVTLRRQSPYAAPQVVTVPAGAQAALGAPQQAVAAAPAESGAEGTGGPVPADGATDGLVTIECPMVGTFYSAPNPDTGPYVSVGASVSADTTICIIEAMKIFNEIKAECQGTIEKVLVQNGDSVEFGQPLYLVRPG